MYGEDRRKFWLGSLLLVLLAVALSAGWLLLHKPVRGTYGAISLSGSSFNFGASWGYPDAPSAYARAQTECAKSGVADCTVRVSLAGICGALVMTGEHNQTFAVTDTDKDAAGAFALAAGFFAVVQTVAFGSFATKFISTSERTTLLWLAGGAAVLLATCGAVLVWADTAHKAKNLAPEGVVQVMNEDDEDGLTAEERFIEDLADTATALRGTNEKRRHAVFTTQLIAVASIAAVLAELLYSLDARLS